MIILALLLAASEATPTAAGGRLELVCGGAGAANRFDQATAHAWDNRGNSASATMTGSRSVGFGDEIRLWIEGEDGRVRMPRAMLPPIHGGDDGWFKLRSVKISDTEIIASVAVNALNSPKLRIDRLTGGISISGKAGDYSGHCTRYEASNVQRQF